MKTNRVRKFLSRYFPTSLRFRLTMLVLVISVFVLVVATTFINDRALSFIEQNSNERLNAANVTLTATVSVWLEPHLNALRNLVSLLDIIGMDAERQKPLLQKMAAAYPYMYLISTTDLKGINVARNDNEKPKDYGDREWFLKARDGAAVTFESLIGKTNHRPALIVAMPIKNEADRVVGVCMFATDLENLTRQVRVTRAGRTGFAYLIDQNNRVIAHPDLVYANNLSDFSSYPPVKALRQGTRGQVSFIDEGGQHWRAYVNELNNGWGVIVQQQEEELLSTQRLFHKVALMIIFTAVLILVCTTWWGVMQTLKPINMLTKAIKRVTPDNMNRLDFEFVHSTSLNPKTMDEVSILSDSFYEMAVRLQAAMVSQEQELSERKRAEEDLKKHRDHLGDLVKERTTELTNSNERLSQEIVERKRVEEAVRESEERYRQLIEQAADGIFMADPKGNYLLVNSKFCEMHGYTKDEMLKLNVIDTYPDELKDIGCQRVQRVTSGESMRFERPIKRKDGTVFQAELSVSRLDDGRHQGFIHDITDRKRAEEEKKRLEDHLVRAQKMESIGTLAGGIAHDFNNLLMGILGNISLILLQFDQTHPVYDRLKSMEGYVQRGSDLTKQLLGFARGGKYEVKPTNLGELIRESSDLFGRTKKEIHIHHKAQKGLWTVEVDQGQIEQVLLNLYVNAWQAMPNGGDLYLSVENVELNDVDVSPYEISPGRFVKVTVTDTGTGMDEATKARIFEPFFTTKERGRGTGLGLASAYGIVKNHGGYIHVESEKDIGSSFMIYFPASYKDVDYDQKPVQELIKGREIVLLIDDEEMILDVSAKMLEQLGYQVIIASGGKMGIQTYEQNKDRIDLVILDMIMPEFGGRESFDTMIRINPSVKVLLSSGYSLDNQAKEIMRKGCKGFIQKPFTMTDLSKKIREILDKQEDSRISFN